jgi:hypothetical protein
LIEKVGVDGERIREVGCLPGAFPEAVRVGRLRGHDRGVVRLLLLEFRVAGRRRVSADEVCPRRPAADAAVPGADGLSLEPAVLRVLLAALLFLELHSTFERLQRTRTAFRSLAFDLAP